MHLGPPCILYLISYIYVLATAQCWYHEAKVLTNTAKQQKIVLNAILDKVEIWFNYSNANCSNLQAVGSQYSAKTLSQRVSLASQLESTMQD